MSLSLYEASIPGYIRMLKNLDALLDKAAAHGLESGTDLATYTDVGFDEIKDSLDAFIEDVSND